MVKIVIQAIELAIGVSVVITVGHIIFSILAGTDLFDYITNIFYDFGDLLGSNFAGFFYTMLIGIVLVYIGRWALSWSSSNGGQTPNGRGN